MKPRPSRLEPTFDKRPWGVLSLAPLYPDRTNLSEKIGEAWLTGEKCQFADGPYAGETLGAAWAKMPTEWIGTLIPRGSAFPILAKFIFTSDKLSIQVHPDDEYAALHEAQAGGCGKTEMWYCISAQHGGNVLIGLKKGVTRDSFRRAIADGTAENCVASVPLRAGDAIFVPAGTVHTIGAGLLLCEIQEQSDITYRVFDYNRRDANGRARDLHIDKAMEVITFGDQRGGKIDPVAIERGAISETYLAACPYFVTEKWGFANAISAQTSREHFELLITISGHGAIEAGGESIPYAPSQAWFIPAALGEYRIASESPTELLRTYVPGALAEFARRLRERGVSADQVARLVHD